MVGSIGSYERIVQPISNDRPSGDQAPIRPEAYATATLAVRSSAAYSSLELGRAPKRPVS
jgi:hypothetical protein